jgi:2-polyprenyl-3-methyl-5-hydroxy-6-metoxy-1,4-benzoquinol methylase
MKENRAMPDDRVKKVLTYTRGPTVLDLGAVQHDLDRVDENSWLHHHIAEEFQHVIGVDILEEEVAELNERGYEFIHADVTKMDLDIQADTVVAGELIEHVDNPGLMLERIQKHIRVGGRLVLTTPNPWALVHIRRLVSNRLSINEEHVAWYGPIVLEQLLERYGFQIEHLVTTNQDHKGLTGMAQKLGSTIFGGTTWVCVAEKEE